MGRGVRPADKACSECKREHTRSWTVHADIIPRVINDFGLLCVFLGLWECRIMQLCKSLIQVRFSVRSRCLSLSFAPSVCVSVCVLAFLFYSFVHIIAVGDNNLPRAAWRGRGSFINRKVSTFRFDSQQNADLQTNKHDYLQTCFAKHTRANHHYTELLIEQSTKKSSF